MAAVAPKPLNVLMSAPWTTMTELAELGVRRVSLGSSLARAAWGSFVRAATTIAREGCFDGLAHAEPFAELDRFFREDRARRAGS